MVRRGRREFARQPERAARGHQCRSNLLSLLVHGKQRPLGSTRGGEPVEPQPSIARPEVLACPPQSRSVGRRRGGKSWNGTSPPRDAGRATALLKTLIFTVLVPGAVAGYVPYWMLSSSTALDSLGAGPFRVLGFAPISLGALGYLWCAWEFAFAGRGTPAPIDPPKILVARGLYRFVRNPMYVSVLLILLGEGLFFDSRNLLVYAACFWIAVHLFVLLYEEPTLTNKFGESYQAYRKTVPRWVPRFPRGTH